MTRTTRRVFRAAIEGKASAKTQTHITGRKPVDGEYKPHPSGAGLLTDAQELSLEDYAKFITTLDTFPVPRTLRRSDVAWILEELTLAPMAMLREVFNLLGLQRVV